ncbi:hypothetical protein MNBD_CHLOROFLEXI01-2733, partial [hydrothermal vent metagenome]
MAKRKTTTRKTKAKPRTTRGGTGKRTPRKRIPSKRKPTPRKKTRKSVSFNVAQKALMVGILVIFVTVILVLSLLSPNQGQLTSALAGLMRRTFGWGSVILPLITGGIGLYLVLWGMEQPPEVPTYRLTGAGLLYLALEGFASLTLLVLNNEFFDPWTIAQAEKGGGYFGGLVASVLMTAVGNLGAIFTLTVLAIIGTILLSGVTRDDMGRFLQALFQKRPSTANTTAQTQRDIPINTGRPKRMPTRDPLQPRLIPEAAEAKAAKETAASASDLSRRSGQAVPKPTKPPRKGRGAQRKAAPEQAETPTIVTPVFLGNNGRSPAA